jgi:hypothetical protein
MLYIYRYMLFVYIAGVYCVCYILFLRYGVGNHRVYLDTGMGTKLHQHMV